MTKKIGRLPQIKNLKKSLYLNKEGKQQVRKARQRLSDIISGKSDRKILIIGPCSSDFESSILEYAAFLSEIQKQVENKIEIVMRFYTGKPRSTVGWKGILHSEPGQDPDLRKGIKYARSLAIKLIQDYNLSLADELLYPDLSARLWDLYSYMAIGARSSEDQLHREVASGLPFPIGIKNPTSGDLKTMNNGVLATSKPSNYVMERVIYQTPGNNVAHGILRGGLKGPNYHDAKSINTPIIIDCNHENSGKQPKKQIEIMKEVMGYCGQNNKTAQKLKVQGRKNISKGAYGKVSDQEVLHSDDKIGSFGAVLKGFMVESYLYDGRQDYSDGLQKGLSLTDPCIGKENTKKFIEEMYTII